MYNLPQSIDTYEPQFIRIVTARSNHPEWSDSPTPSCIYIPHTRFLAMNNTLKNRPVADDVIDGIVDYVNRELDIISDDFINQNYHELNIIVGEGYVIKGRIFRVEDRQAIFDDSVGGDEMQDLTIGVCIYFNDLTDLTIAEALHFDNLRLSQTGEFILKYSKDTLSLVLSRGFLTSLGKRKGETIFLDELVPIEYLDKTREEILLAIENGENNFETRMIDDEGKLFWVSVHLKTEKKDDSNGTIAGFVKNIDNEMKERLIIEKNYREQQIALRLMSGVIYTVEFDDENNPKFIQTPEADSFGIQWEKLESDSSFNTNPFYMMIDPRDRVQAIEEFKKIKNGEPLDIQFRIVISDDGEVRNVHNYVIPTFNHEGKVTGATGGFIDVTELVAKQSYEELLSKISMLVHDLKNPLQVIIFAVATLKKHIDKFTFEQKTEQLQWIRDSVDGMNKSIEGMLMIAKAEQEDSKEYLSIRELIPRCFEEAQVLDRHVEINFRGTRDIIFTNTLLITHAFVNLITNADKYSPKETNIEIYIVENPNFIEVSIRDYGIGIPTEDQKAIFKEFKRASNVGKINGSGVGLVSVFRTIKNMGPGYDMSFTSSGVDGEGCEFKIIIPTQPAPVEP
ncbi:MAG: ATP-binding protein [Candidatus Dojkabacteria bacterium]